MSVELPPEQRQTKRKKRQVFDPPPAHAVNLRIPEFCALFGVSRSTAYLLIQRGELRAIKAGKSCRIPRAEAERWQRELERRAGIAA
jgi:excisionase family DNA binding protein